MSDFVILNGFDRSGSSAISRLLLTHPQIELIMQPFNSGFIRDKMYQILDENDPNSSEHQFFTDLSHNVLNNDLIKSHWHTKHSSTKEYKEGKLHIIKTTINHFAQKWMTVNYPEIDVWGIWREPQAIVDSIIRNNVYNQWYDEALTKIIPTVQNTDLLKEHYFKFINYLKNEVTKTAFLVAVRSHFFFKYLPAEKVINYEEFKINSNYLNIFLITYGLAEKDFSTQASQDLNITGKYKKKKKKMEYSRSEQDLIDEIFHPLRELVKNRHNIS